MQTFLPHISYEASAASLDNKRLFKQIVEATQILDVLFGLKSGWANHPAVKMWRGHENELIKYTKAFISEWKSRKTKSGRNCQCPKSEAKIQIYERMIVEGQVSTKPPWLTSRFCLSHKSNLIRKDKEFYGSQWDVKDDLPYVWPV